MNRKFIFELSSYLTWEHNYYFECHKSVFPAAADKSFVVLNRMHWLDAGPFSIGIILHFIGSCRYIAKDGKKKLKQDFDLIT